MSYSITSAARASSAGGTLSLAYPLRARSSRPMEARYGRKIGPVWWCGVELAFKWGAMH